MKTTKIDQKLACNQADRQKTPNKKQNKTNPSNQYQNCGIAYIITRIESTYISKFALYKFNT